MAPTDLRPLRLPPTRLPGLSPLLGGDLWQRWAADGRVFAHDNPVACVGYLRLKASSCRLLFASGAETAQRVPELWQVVLYPDAERARSHFVKLDRRKAWHPDESRRPFLDVEAAAVGVHFPLDPALGQLRHLFRPYRLADAVERATGARPNRSEIALRLLAYKPERRAVLHLAATRRSGEGVLRVVKRDDADELVEHLSAVDRLTAPQGLGPGLLGVDRKSGLIVCSYRPGRPIVRDEANPAVLDALGRAARHLASLHRIDASGMRAAAPRRRAADLVQPLGTLLPQAIDRIERLARVVDAEPAQPRALVHGDLHLGQILDDGNLIDWDRSGHGDPLADLGALAAHLYVCAAPALLGEAFLDAYRSAAGNEIDANRLRRLTGRALFFRLGDPFRKLSRDWHERMSRQLETAERLLR